MSSLYVIRGKDQGYRFEIEPKSMILGRDGTSDIRLNDQEVSRHHAEIRFEADAFVLHDLKSSNHTYVNSQQIERQTLRTGDRIQVGSSVLLFTETRRVQRKIGNDTVSVIRDPAGEPAAKIITSVGQEEGSRIFRDSDEFENPWSARAKSNLQVMYRTALAVSHTLDIDQLLERILELIFEWVEADRGCIMLLHPKTDELEPKATKRRVESSGTSNIEISQTILDYVMKSEEGVLTSDAQDDQRWEGAASIVRMGVREAICVPLQGRYGIVGVIYVDTYSPAGNSLRGEKQRFTAEQLRLMVAIGYQAALAVEDTYYYLGMVQSERLAAIGQTIATLSHHIKNILQGIRGGSYLIEEGLKDADQEVVAQGWKIVDKNQERISNLVMDMLSFSKERKPDLVPGDIQRVVEDVVELMQSRAASSDVSLTLEPSDSIPEFGFDPEGIHRAVLNVVSNAIDACQERKGHVRVGWKQDAAARLAKVYVQDDGGGIAAEDIKKIFSIFESRKGSRGTGLGLPVSQKILKEHGGDIHLTSEPGVGSRFELVLPMDTPPEPPVTTYDAE